MVAIPETRTHHDIQTLQLWQAWASLAYAEVVVPHGLVKLEGKGLTASLAASSDSISSVATLC